MSSPSLSRCQEPLTRCTVISTPRAFTRQELEERVGHDTAQVVYKLARGIHDDPGKQESHSLSAMEMQTMRPIACV